MCRSQVHDEGNLPLVEGDAGMDSRGGLVSNLNVTHLQSMSDVSIICRIAS